MLLIDRLELAIQQRSIKPNPPMEDSVRQSLPMILIRMMVGLVFLLEGILKFVRPEDVGAGRFAVIGIPFPQQVAALVGGVEIVGGAAILLNFYAGEAALVLLVVILTAVVTTKIPILLGRPLGPFALEKLPRYGWLSFLHQARTDFCMIFGLVVVLIDSGLHIVRRKQWYQRGES